MLLDDVATYLAANTTRLTIGSSGSLWKSDLPDTPNTVAAVFETGGFGPQHFFSTSAGTGGTRGYENPGLQVLSRSTSYQTARTVIEDVFVLLDGVAGQQLPTATGPTYISIDAIQSPFLIHRDENHRFVLGVNFNVAKTTG